MAKTEIPNCVPEEELNAHLHTIAHEMRHPLIAIQGFTSLLSEKYSDSLPEEGQEFLERITHNIKRAESLLSDISKLANAGVKEEAFEEICSRQLIETAVEGLHIQIREGNVEIDIQEDMPRILCDKQSMILVFINLIGNAIKYARNKSVPKISIGCLDDELFYKFFIKDNGIGFRSQDRNRVFILFNRLRNKRNVSGSGVGLAIVKKTIDDHDGLIKIHSEQNIGTSITLCLPI